MFILSNAASSIILSGAVSSSCIKHTSIHLIFRQILAHPGRNTISTGLRVTPVPEKIPEDAIDSH